MESQKAEKDKIYIHFEKNPLYRSIYADGAVGSISPSNDLNLCFYATRNIIPKAIIRKVDESGLVGEEMGVSEDSKSGIIHEIEVGVYMNKETAKKLYGFLKKIFDDGTH